MADLTVILLTYNEEMHIARALRSVASFAAEIIVVDSYSTDNTVDIAASFGTRVIQRRFINQAEQFQWALENIQITTTWVMRLDADEVVESTLSTEINQRLSHLDPNTCGIKLKRKHFFMGRWIKYGDRYPLILLRIWRNGCARVENRWMDEHILLIRGAAITFDGDFRDHNLNDLSYFVDKHNKYATREALAVVGGRYRLFGEVDSGQLSGQAAVKRFLKVMLYERMPIWIGPPLYFCYRYFLRLGFFDGVEGLIYHSLQCGWYRFVVAAKIIEFERALRGVEGAQAQIDILSGISGLDAGSQNTVNQAMGPSSRELSGKPNPQ